MGKVTRWKLQNGGTNLEYVLACEFDAQSLRVEELGISFAFVSKHLSKYTGEYENAPLADDAPYVDRWTLRSGDSDAEYVLASAYDQKLRELDAMHSALFATCKKLEKVLEDGRNLSITQDARDKLHTEAATTLQGAYLLLQDQ